MCLQWIQNALNEAKSDYKEIGRPLTLRMHDGKYTSLLDSAYDTSNFGKMNGGDNTQLNMSGITNLLIILLLVTNIKNIMLTYKNYGFTLKDVVDEIFVNRVFETLENYESIAAVMILGVFVILSYWIEVLASSKVNQYVIMALIFLNEAALLTYTTAIAFIIKPGFIVGSMLQMTGVCLFLKTVSFHHVMFDVRWLCLKIKKVTAQG